jgi:UDP-N-acetylglucosamine--N-acetylmuramyl-(pentapeptide) pyrophosphoryl-undecaprenol N-acetylglucosamine transferase
MRVAIAGGGTAGHVNPALALAAALEGDEVVFLGTARGAEATLVPAAGYPLETIEVRGFDRARPASILAVGWVALGAVAAAVRVLRQLKPAVMVGMGGYVSLPACFAARVLRIPVVLHEQNIVLGLANRVCRPLAARLALSFAETLGASRRAVVVGNPVSPMIASADHAAERARGLERFDLDPARRTLLTFGGSQGARRINDATEELARLWAGRADRQLVHVAGRAAATPARASDRGRAGLVYRRVAFVERMVEAYAVADLALCRGGATTVAELLAMGLPAIIVPYPHHRDRQQERHALVLERAGAAVVMQDSEASAERVAAAADPLLSDDAELARMRGAARALAIPDAAERLAAVVREAAS